MYGMMDVGPGQNTLITFPFSGPDYYSFYIVTSYSIIGNKINEKTKTKIFG